MTKIAMLAAGSSIHSVRWANALAGRGFDIHLISMHPFLEGIDRRVSRHRLPLPPPLGYAANRRALRALIERVRPAVLNTHYASGYGTLGRAVRSTPTVLNVWGADVYDFPLRSPLHRRVVRGNLARADVVCSTSHVMAEQSRRICPAMRRLEVVPFGVDTSRFAPRPAAGETDKITIGTVKSLAPKYGIDTLIKGFAHCRRTLAPGAPRLAARLRLRIVGHGPQRGALQRLAHHEGVAAVTRFVGPVPHERVPAELHKLDIYVAMSRRDSESFGVAVVEALATERAVVVSDAGGLPEVVRHRETGLVTPRDDPPALATALRELIEQPRRRAALAAAGRGDVRRRYEWDRNVTQMATLLQGVARQARPLVAA